MNKIGILALLILSGLLVSSCFKEDELVTPHPRGGVKSDTIPMTEYYTYQLYFSLDSGKVIRKNLKSQSDLGFECANDGWRILLNTSNFMRAGDLGRVLFGAHYDTTGMQLLFDKSDGNPDSTAINIWFETVNSDTVSNGHVYAISRGLDEYGNPLGLVQVIFDSLKHGTYYFRHAPLGGGKITSAQVTKYSSVHYLWYSFKGPGVVDLEPEKTSYELLFTQYTTMLYTDEGIPYPYLVTGALINRQGITIARDTVHPFPEISKDIIPGLTFSKTLDAVGYDWKYYSFSSGAYTVVPNLSYVIRNSKGFLYKLRFIGFYDKNGAKGYPVIEYEAL